MKTINRNICLKNRTRKGSTYRSVQLRMTIQRNVYVFCHWIKWYLYVFNKEVNSFQLHSVANRSIYLIVNDIMTVFTCQFKLFIQLKCSATCRGD